MPRLDGSGPLGWGPLIGRGQGRCFSYKGPILWLLAAGIASYCLLKNNTK